MNLTETTLLTERAIELIRKHASESEQRGQLHPEIVALIESEKWFKMYVPKDFGGLDIAFPEILNVLESLAKADGSVGWTVTLCSGASWFAGFMNEELVRTVFLPKNACITGSGATTGTAQKIENGFLVNGNWKHASGALHATHFTANCKILNEEGEQVFKDDGSELIESFLFTKDEVTILSNWKYMGMVATGSHGFSIENKTVPSNRSFTINGKETITTNARNYPFRQLAETTLAVNFSGMLLSFFDALNAYLYEVGGIKRFTEEQKLIVENAIAQAKSEFESARLNFFETAQGSWNELLESNLVSEELLAEVSSSSRTLVRVSRDLIHQLFPYCGLEIVRTNSELNRIWRNLNTAVQHSLFIF